MSPTLLAHLRRIERQTREYVSADNADRRAGRPHLRRPGGRQTNVTDFYRPLECVRMSAWNRPRAMGWPAATR